MPFGTWWRGDPLPDLSHLPRFSVQLSTDMELIARLANYSEQTVHLRIQDGNHAYIAFIDDAPVAYGWVALREGGISGFQFSFAIPARNCYLWDFLTLPQWRGRGIYPRFLQAILRQQQFVDHFWIGYEPGNMASAHGIMKAGFSVVCDLVISEGRVSGLTLFASSERAQASAAFLHLPIVDGP